MVTYWSSCVIRPSTYKKPYSVLEKFVPSVEEYEESAFAFLKNSCFEKKNKRNTGDTFSRMHSVSYKKMTNVLPPNSNTVTDLPLEVTEGLRET